MKNNHQPPRRVDFFLYKDDYECAYLAALGFSTAFIQNKTGLSSGKVTYRCKKAAIKRADYRNGASVYAQIVTRNLKPAVERELTQYLKTGIK